MTAAALTIRIGTVLLSAPMFIKMMGLAVGVAVLLGAGLFWQIAWYNDELGELKARARSRADHVAVWSAPLLRGGRLAELQQLVENVADLSPELLMVRIRDDQGGIVASAGRRDDGVPSIDVTVPVAEELPFVVEVSKTDAFVAAEIADHVRWVLGTIGVVALTGIATAWALSRLFTRPLRALVENARAVKEGFFATRTPVWANDEIGELAVAFNDMSAALQEHEADRQELMRKIIAAAEEERKRVARELHDGTGQALTSLIAGLAGLENGGRASEVDALRALAKQALAEVHDLAVTLRPSVLDDLGLEPALDNLCQGFGRRFDINVDYSAVGMNGTSRFPSEIEVALYRVAQEALTNAVRHGQAHSVEVLLQRKPDSVLIVIEDDGRGFDARHWRSANLNGDHLGLLGIAERAALLRGTMCVESRPGNGTSVFVEIPLASARPVSTRLRSLEAELAKGRKENAQDPDSHC